MLSDRKSRPATKIKDGCVSWQHLDKAIVPGLIVPGVTGALCIPRKGMALIVTDNEVGKSAH
jgi:hypothetical protein